jgi:O-acetyl-ADP-ribose deacetylase (regulator of RNase III)
MGAGIAKVVREMFPKNYEAYRKNCDLRFLVPGQTFVYKENDLFIFNMATQDQPGADAEYRHVLRAGADAAEQCLTLGVDRLAIPLIGCGIGGLQWDMVEEVLRSIESVYDNFEFEVWKL